MQHKICTLRCKILTANIEDVFGDAEEQTGFFEGELLISENDLKKSMDPPGLVNERIALALRKAIEETDMPRERWIADFSPWAQKHFNFPATLPFS